MTSARASLVILSRNLGGTDIGERLGMMGDQQWNAGDPVRPGSKSQQRFGGWALNSRVDRSQPAAAHLEDLLARASSVATPLSVLRNTGEIESSRVWLHLDTPEAGFAIEPDVLRAIANLGSLEVDLYG
jgi:hypothetical protein